MELGLAGKRVLITGASKGIGRAVAELMAAEGCDLVLVSRTRSDLDDAKAAIAKTCKVRIDVVAADVADGAVPIALARDYPDVDIMVNNAGAIPGGTLLDMDEARWRVAWDLKVFGYINMCREFYAAMKARGSGVIVNMLGASAVSHDPDLICSSTGNAALTVLTQALGSVSAKDGIRVVGISPGLVTTDRMIRVLRTKSKMRTGRADDWPEILKELPFGRAGTPEEVASAVAYLASDRSGYTSGVVLVMDAGLTSRAHDI